MERKNERGAAAVELAIVLPVLLLILMGIIEFGHAYNAQLTLTQAAREGVRTMAISNDPTAARTATRNAARTLYPNPTDIDIAPAACTPGATATLTITYPLATITGVVGPITLKGKGVMRCGG
ncbi:TadE/TadG family type IV pilus assembly protein [Arthrobacter sp. JSM 101049]|uniref:TadE/TadG family type IV pilus assembly protein n=1 Tax=Arthrobacter sp. JSM 101049 TaxID=929097 RepID=UPI003561FDE4